MMKRIALFGLCFACCVGLLAGCACSQTAPGQSAAPRVTPLASTSAEQGAKTAEFKLPDALEAREGQAPLVKVYVLEEEKVVDMDLEEYLQGVLAGELKNDWPMEALKAQAILARSFALKFIADKGGSKYEGAHLSTDIEEAQAYDASGINERIVQAIEETRGEVLSYDGEPIYAWFHSHSGGTTALAKEGLGYEKDEPPYTKIVSVTESGAAEPDAREWQASFTLAEMQKALDAYGGGQAENLAVGQWSDSGRALTFTAGGGEIPAPAFRLELGGTKLRSTKIKTIAVQDGKIVISGVGYGHGVGMSQWGAYAMAEEGMKAEEIVQYFFKDVELVKAW
ncbi:MAG: SpoIID/LytB domain-containing protein [Christensenellaceae bacterium]|jgi:stage II sporulation protein D|nr:SpoIID/LytB domain-containing protein [Christensenellaceae bacterium]